MPSNSANVPKVKRGTAWIESSPMKATSMPSQPAIQPLSGIAACRHRARDHDADDREPEHLPGFEIERKSEDQRDEQDQKNDADAAADEGRGDGHAERLTAFATLGQLVAFDHGRHRIWRAGNVDQDGRDRAAEHAAGIDAEHEADRDVLRHGG